MNVTMQLAVVVAIFLCLAEGAPDGRLVRSKQQRPTRGFKNLEMMTARGFGKRARTELIGMGNFWESLDGTQEKDGQEIEEKTVESIPMDWFINEMLNNPDFTRSVVRKFIDINQDGTLSAEELLRNVA